MKISGTFNCWILELFELMLTLYLSFFIIYKVFLKDRLTLPVLYIYLSLFIYNKVKKGIKK